MFAIRSKSFKTEIYRKSVHLSSLWMPLLIMSCSRNFCILLFACLLALDFIAEYSAYRKSPIIGTIFRRMFIKTLRNKEINPVSFTPSGSIYILAAALFVSVCFSTKAASAMCVVLIADSFAALTGKFFGTFRFSNGKSLEGSAVFFISAVLIGLSFFPSASPSIVYWAAFLAAAAEFFEKQVGVDDNLSIPLISGFMFNLIV